MINATIMRFGYPRSVLATYAHWVVMLRPDQITVGAMVVACTEDATHLGDVSAAAGAELLPRVIADVEQALATTYRPDKVNHLALMMVDPHVHLHVIPRYSGPVTVHGRAHIDHGWPGPPAITRTIDIDSAGLAVVHDRLADAWPSP